jgi:N-acyl-D-amino-acid deacylase
MEGWESVIGTSMIEPDIEKIMRWPYTNFSSDGSSTSLHPRGFGAFPRVLGRYVRGRGVLGLSEAIRRMTSLAADNMDFRDRGRLAPGMAADLVLFDPGTVLDRSTTKDPHATAVGIERVWVNGIEVFDGRTVTGATPGVVLRRRGTGR